MSISGTKTMMLGTTIGLVARMAVLTPASARGRHHHHHHFRAWHAPVIVTSDSGSCGFYYRKWKRTGSAYWRSQYFACID